MLRYRRSVVPKNVTGASALIWTLSRLGVFESVAPIVAEAFGWVCPPLALGQNVAAKV